MKTTSIRGPTTRSSKTCWSSTSIGRGVVVVVSEVSFGIPLVDHQVNGHLAFQTRDVSLTEVVAQFMDLLLEWLEEDMMMMR